MRDHNVCFYTEFKKLSLIIVKYSSRALTVLHMEIQSTLYSPTCVKQAPKGQSKSACLGQVLA